MRIDSRHLEKHLIELGTKCCERAEARAADLAQEKKRTSQGGVLCGHHVYANASQTAITQGLLRCLLYADEYVSLKRVSLKDNNSTSGMWIRQKFEEPKFITCHSLYLLN